MPALVRIHQPVDARVEQGELDRRYIEVDVDFAARLQTRHTRRFECTARETPGGREQFTRDVPNVGEDALAQLDDAGLIKLGSEVESGTILVGRVTPRVGPTLSPEEKLLRAIFGEAASDVVDASVRSPAWCAGVVTGARITTGADGLAHAFVELEWERPLALGDVLLIADEPDPATARLLASVTVTVHVPLMHEAALQCAELDDDPQPRAGVCPPGWLSHAREHGRFVASAVVAAQRGDRDALEDAVVALALGRIPAPLDPSTRERWAAQQHERRERVWARRTPPAGAPEQAPRNLHFERRLDELELTTAAARLLDGAGITTVGELCQQSEASLLERGFGRKRLAEVKQILAELGLSLGMR
jgi:hypothetical protein